ncbi:uncharacterized protein LOC106871214 isoform X2 [Octopus bimaculoides]|uniref:uncharacterized protein LOC106871214 isoform X2 n=1 Tax=Octopus bimaculoides TaxID=37653 RepID=UPI0022E66954|nr:uncharacterized protein LOC106871214 isoform X2 [Octopus bimaculoides]
MLTCNDPSACKNACFALSCIFIKKWNQDIFLSSPCCIEILETLAKLLFSEDHETGWFAAVTLHTIAKFPRGCLQIRRHTTVETSMKNSLVNKDNQDLVEEITSALKMIKRLEKPSPPRIRHIDSTWLEIEWNQVISKCGFIITYKIFIDQSCVNQITNGCHCLIDSLKPSTKYRIQLQVTADEDESPLSESVSVTTAEEIPEAPKNLRLVAQTQNQVKLTWDPPSNCNTAVKYIILTECETQNYSKKQTVMENISFINGLLPATNYILQVAAANRRGRGPFSSLQINTPDKYSYIPPKLNVAVIGRNEIHLSWLPPKDALGRVNRYEVFMDGAMVYSGNNMTLALTRLTPDTEYTFVVSAITNEGRLYSAPLKKKTVKGDFDIETIVSKSVTNLVKNKYFSQKPIKSYLAPRRCKSAYCLKRNHSKIKASASASLLTKRTSFQRHQSHSASQFMHYMHNQRHNAKSTQPSKCSTEKSLALLQPNQINISLYGHEVNILDSEFLLETGESLDFNKAIAFRKTPANSSLGNRLHTAGEIIEPFQSIPNKENMADTYEERQFSKKLLTSVWNIPQSTQNRRLKKTSAKQRTEKLRISTAKHIYRETDNSCCKDTKSRLELKIPREELVFNEESSGSKETRKNKHSKSTATKVDRRTITIARSLHNLKLNEDKRLNKEQMRLSPSVGTTKKFCTKEISEAKLVPKVNGDNPSSGIKNEDENIFPEKLSKSECNSNQDKRQKSKNIVHKNKYLRSSSSGKHLPKSASSLTSSSGKSKVTRMRGKSTNLSSPQLVGRSNGTVKESKTSPGKINSSHKLGHWKNTVKSDASKSDLTSNAVIEQVVYSTRKPSSTGRAKSSYPRLSKVTLTSDVAEYRHKSAGHGENFMPSQIRSQPSNLNLRQLERIHSTLSEMKDNKGNSNLRRIIYKKIQDMLPTSLSIDPSLSFNTITSKTNKQSRKSKSISTLFGKQIQLNGIKLNGIRLNGTKPPLKSSKTETDSMVLHKS